MRLIPFLFLSLAAVAPAQRVTDSRTADIRGGGGDGKCTIEVDVDDAAEVDITGNRAQIRTLAGGPARIVRFVCNQVMPANPYDFRFQGVDGRGRQTLVREPNRGAAVIRIDDPDRGREGYTFDIFWRNGSGGYSGGYNGGNRPGGYDRPGYDRPPVPPPAAGGWNRNLNFRGRGDGAYIPARGRRESLYDCRVTISPRGDVEVRFETGRTFSMVLTGRVLRMDRGRIWADMAGQGLRGEMSIDVDGRDRVTDVFMSGAGRDRFEIRWRN